METSFHIGKKPELKQHKFRDHRRYIVIPYSALTNKKVSNPAFRTLAAFCSYADKAGLTRVSQRRVAQDLKLHTRSVSRHVGELKASKLLKVLSHSYTVGLAGKALQIVFVEGLKANEAQAIANEGMLNETTEGGDTMSQQSTNLDVNQVTSVYLRIQERDARLLPMLETDLIVLERLVQAGVTERRLRAGIKRALKLHDGTLTFTTAVNQIRF
jgi:hypothetical protein